VCATDFHISAQRPTSSAPRALSRRGGGCQSSSAIPSTTPSGCYAPPAPPLPPHASPLPPRRRPRPAHPVRDRRGWGAPAPERQEGHAAAAQGAREDGAVPAARGGAGRRGAPGDGGAGVQHRGGALRGGREGEGGGVRQEQRARAGLPRRRPPRVRRPRTLQRRQVLAHQRAHAPQGGSAHLQEAWYP
jgi:hypothetical protein